MKYLFFLWLFLGCSSVETERNSTDYLHLSDEELKEYCKQDSILNELNLQDAEELNYWYGKGFSDDN